MFIYIYTYIYICIYIHMYIYTPLPAQNNSAMQTFASAHGYNVFLDVLGLGFRIFRWSLVFETTHERADECTLVYLIGGPCCLG